jgi:hypothetical protein
MLGGVILFAAMMLALSEGAAGCFMIETAVTAGISAELRDEDAGLTPLCPGARAGQQKPCPSPEPQ